MSIFTRFLFVLVLCFNLVACARREQALYQRSPREQFSKTVPQAAIPEEIRVSSPDTSHSVVVNETVAISASIKPDIPVSRSKSAWHGASISAPVPTKEVVDQPVTYQKKASSRKAFLKNIVAETPIKTSGLAVAALVCGILSFFVLAVVLGPLAIIFGGVAMAKIRRNPELRGRGLAVAGLVLGIVATVLIVAILGSR